MRGLFTEGKASIALTNGIMIGLTLLSKKAGADRTRRRRRSRRSRRDRETGSASEGATGILIEDNIPREMILTSDTPNMPTDMPFFVTNEDHLISLRATLDMPFGRNNEEALTPPDTEVRKIGLLPLDNFIRSQ